MPTQPLPTWDHNVTPANCLALAAYWEAQAERDDVNPETILVALSEAKHWRDVADTIEFLLRVTPFEYPDSNDPRFKRKRGVGPATPKPRNDPMTVMINKVARLIK